MARIVLAKKEAQEIIGGVVGNSELLTASEVCKVLGRSKSWVSSLKSRGYLKLHDTQSLYTRESLLKYMTTKSKDGRPMKRD